MKDLKESKQALGAEVIAGLQDFAPPTLLAQADNAVDAGLVVAVSAGNSGPGQGTVGSPGRARKVITVASSTNKHFVGQPFTYPDGGGTTIGAAVMTHSPRGPAPGARRPGPAACRPDEYRHGDAS